MTGNSHMIIGTGLTMATLHQAHFTPQFGEDWLGFITAVAIGTFASLLPDGLDVRNSKLKSLIKGGGNRTHLSGRIIPRSQRRKLGGSILYAILTAIEWTVRSLLGLLFDVISFLMPHRGPTHYVSTALLLTISVWLMTVALEKSPIYALVFGVGYFSHIWADSMTRSGVKLLGPLTSRAFYALPFGWRLRTERTATLSERLAVGAILLLAGMAFVVPTADQYLRLVVLVVGSMYGVTAVADSLRHRQARRQAKT